MFCIVCLFSAPLENISLTRPLSHALNSIVGKTCSGSKSASLKPRGTGSIPAARPTDDAYIGNANMTKGYKYDVGLAYQQMRIGDPDWE